MNILIVDDESLSRESLSFFIKNNKFLKNKFTVFTAESSEEARDIIKSNSIDILLLDIEMPNENGLQFLAKMKSIQFQVIIITAYQEYALEAFKMSAQNYILKPIDDNLLLDAIKQCVINIKLKKKNTFLKKLFEITNIFTTKKIALPTIEGLQLIEIEKIYYLKACGNYTEIVCNNEKFTSSKNIKYFEERLPNKMFIRIHDSSIINISKTNKYIKGSGGYVIMDNKVSLDVSVRRKKNLLNLLENN
jgi:two-component system LytT family response regulator